MFNRLKHICVLPGQTDLLSLTDISDKLVMLMTMVMLTFGSTFSKDRQFLRHFVFIVTRIVVASVIRLSACGANSVSTIVVTIIHESKLRNFEWNLKAIFHRINNKEIQSH